MPRPNIEAFLNSPYIKSIAGQKRWTISDRNKRPLDIVRLLSQEDPNNPGHFYGDFIRGALYPDERCLVSLYELIDRMPNAANFACYTPDALYEGHVILDVEPSCDESFKNWFLQTDYIYGEYSMSGRGYHFVYKTPECFKNYPIAMTKAKIQSLKKDYEFMLGGHYLTFTANLLPPATGSRSIDHVFETLCSEQSLSEIAKDVNVMALKPEIPNEDMLLDGLLHYNRFKTLADFHNNFSSYEFSCCSRLFHQLKRLMKLPLYNPQQIEYTENQMCWLVYMAAKNHIPFREKHNEYRVNGNQKLPWLLWEATQVAAKASDPDSDSPENNQPNPET